MWKPYKACNICSLILNGDSELKKRIYDSTHFSPQGGGESLIAILATYGGTVTKGGVFTYPGLLNHVKKHQVLDDHMRIRRSTAALKEIKVDVPMLQAQVSPDEIYQEALSQGLDALQKGELKLTARDVLRAATDKANIDLKKKDQEFKLAEMIYHFSSGEASNATAYDRRIIEGQAATAYDAADITAGNLTTE
jgi:hypothetical protein